MIDRQLDVITVFRQQAGQKTQIFRNSDRERYVYTPVDRYVDSYVDQQGYMSFISYVKHWDDAHSLTNEHNINNVMKIIRMVYYYF